MMVLGIIIFSNSLRAQESSFDFNNLKIEDFNDEKVQDGLVLDDEKRNTFKINNSDYSKGLYIRKDN